MKQKAEHAGYKRDVLEFNPPRYDLEGDELDDEDSDATADADSTDNPFLETSLEGKDFTSPYYGPRCRRLGYTFEPHE